MSDATKPEGGFARSYGRTLLVGDVADEMRDVMFQVNADVPHRHMHLVIHDHNLRYEYSDRGVSAFINLALKDAKALGEWLCKRIDVEARQLPPEIPDPVRRQRDPSEEPEIYRPEEHAPPYVQPSDMTQEQMIAELERDKYLSLRYPVPTDASAELLLAFSEAANQVLVGIKDFGESYPGGFDGAWKRIRQMDWRLAVLGLYCDYNGSLKRPEDCGLVKDMIGNMSKPGSHLNG